MFASRRCILILAALLAACDESTVAPPEPLPASGSRPALPITVTWQHPLPQGNDLFRMWGFPDGTFYAVGEAGTVLHHDGVSPTMVDTPTREDLRGVWASTPNLMYACGSNGTLIRFDGTRWDSVSTPTDDDLYAVWASSPSDVFVAGSNGSVWNQNSGAWTEFPIAPGQRLHCLWGYSHNEVYVGGSTARLFRFNGTNWTRLVVFDDPAIDAEIYDLWGPAPGSISMVDRWNILWFNGAWNGIQVFQSNGLGLWGFALNQQVAVSDQVSTHLIGTQRRSFAMPTLEPFFDVWGTSMANLYAVGRSGSLAHFDGTAWQALNQESLTNLNDIWATTATAIAVGNDGSILRQNGSNWIDESVGSNYDLAGAWETGGFAVAVGRFTPNAIDWRQAILVNNGAGWSDIGPVGDAHQMFDVWGSDASDVYAVGWAGEILRYNGLGWAVVDAGSGDAAYLKSVSGTPGNVIAVGRTDDLHGLVCRFDGTTWTKTQLNDVEELSGVWVESATHAFAVGANGAVRRFDGTAWTKMKTPTRAPLFCVWGDSPSDVYAGGVGGTLIHYDGSGWRELLPATNRSINSVAGRSKNEIYFAGDKGSILLFEGL